MEATVEDIMFSHYSLRAFQGTAARQLAAKASRRGSRKACERAQQYEDSTDGEEKA